MALRQIPSISSSNRASAAMVALFLVPLGLPKGLPECPFLNFPCFFSVLSGILLFPNTVVLAESIASKLVSVYNCLFSLVPVFLAFRGDREERYPDKIDEKF